MAKKIIFYKTLLLFLTGFSTLFAQQVQLKGTVIDSTQNPVPYTNLIASPLVENQDITFAITDNQGRYKLNLVHDVSYQIEITHMGFSKQIDTLQLSAFLEKNYTLQESTESLEQVIIKQEMAVIVKEDTITYRTDQFKTGEERKLREVLKKLPGVEVDREGNVTVNGKKVTKLMVEGKTFFTGDSKLAVNNIPADAVDEVEALDNYSEVSFLKGLNDSDQMALNIKLKEGKKEFVFGDIEVGGGVKERFLFHPTLFYYSPKTAVNVIGDVNNIGKKSFTIQDYINFEGGYAAMMDGSTSFGNIYNSDFAQFLNQKDFTYQKNDFGAGSISQQLSNALRLEAFSIVNKGKTDTRVTNNITYLTDDAVDENRETATHNEVFFTLNKLKLRYQPNSDNDLAYEAFIKTSNGDASQNLNSFTAEDTTLTRILQQPKNLSVNQEIRYNKQFSYEHTSTLIANYTYNDQQNDNSWWFNQPVFNNLIPFQEDGDFYNLLQNSASKKHQATVDLKHYWVLNNFNHIYPRVGSTYLNQSFGSVDQQKLQDGNFNSFLANGFNNDVQFNLIDTYVGFQYKAKAGDFIFKPGLMYHAYFWKVDQFTEEVANKQKSVWLPELNIEYEISSAEKLKLDYRLKTSFSQAEQYANRLRLVSFNQLYRGNENLENQLYHSASLRYHQFNMYKGIFINANVSYTKREKSIRNTTQIEGIDQVNTSIYTSLPENNYNAMGSFAKQISKYKFTLSGNLSWADYSRVVNDELNDYQSNNYGYTIKAETRFKDWPNLELGWEQGLNNFKSDRLENKFTKINPYAVLDWDFLNDFIFSADYTYNYYKNLNTDQVNQFDVGNLSLYYNQEDSPWGFEIDVDNVFDVRYKNENSFNQFLVSDTNIFIQPRTVLFKLSYKL
ncbi:carboxypeptidase-like regulatory domain-containing protein [Mesonia sp.]|uniref:carboxypeptidase-like regulatory domain-containing protein n=1 Tax=Mesonia sp. TaxID=1960830 RepID=UPI003F9BAFD7